MVCLDFASMTEFGAYIAIPTRRNFLRNYKASMAYISAIQVSARSGSDLKSTSDIRYAACSRTTPLSIQTGGHPAIDDGPAGVIRTAKTTSRSPTPRSWARTQSFAKTPTPRTRQPPVAAQRQRDPDRVLTTTLKPNAIDGQDLDCPPCQGPKPGSQPA